MKRWKRLAAGVALCLPLAVPAQAQPADTLKIVVPFAASGPTDMIARIIAVPFGELVGRKVVVENRGGAGGVVGTAVAARAPADGSTLLLTTSSLVITAGTTPNLTYDPRKDFDPIFLLGEVQTMLVTRSTLGAADLDALVAKAKGPTRLNYGSTGVGGTMHIGAELLARSAKVDMVHVPYRGAAPAIVALLAGDIDLLNADVPVLQPYVKDGRVKAIVIYDTKRSPQLPDVPTAKEAGMPGLMLSNWYGVLAPAGMPADLRRKYEEALAKVVQMPDVAARLAEAGFSGPRDSAAFRTKLAADFDRWIPWLKEAGIKAQ
ncbi:MAG: tripartite tricarboxylate transporter substrate binding protein [Burkholderiales bacterium]|jgi:tripartite-type tricarboxylate transporter receptor subunit TctC|nr:tripartite tricarboxylate transporter substrate binding protein [Burkholderiales bacterium]